jgi:hypothetical protein
MAGEESRMRLGIVIAAAPSRGAAKNICKIKRIFVFATKPTP